MLANGLGTGVPATAVTPDNIADVWKIIEADCRMSYNCLKSSVDTQDSQNKPGLKWV